MKNEEQLELLETIRARIGEVLLLNDPAHTHDLVREIAGLLADAGMPVNPEDYAHPRRGVTC